MKRILLSVVLVVVCASLAAAQDRAARPVKADDGQQMPTPATVTPDMWYYSQETRRYDDPKQAVRRKAEFVAQQRAARIAAMNWFGMSNARPVASTTPSMSVYAPAWIGNGYDRFDWVGVGYPQVAEFYSPSLIAR